MDGFHITVLYNFFDEEVVTKLQNQLPYINYAARLNIIENINHIWFSANGEEWVSKIMKDKCEKLLNKKFKVNLCSYTMLATVAPVVHCDHNKNCDYQIIVYVKGNTNLHKGTGFYLNNELNTHIGFAENRAVIWHANTYHSPLNWASDDKSKRYSVICQLKEIDD